MQILRWCLSVSFSKAGCRLVSCRMAFPWFYSCQDHCGINYAYAGL